MLALLTENKINVSQHSTEQYLCVLKVRQCEIKKTQ